MFDIGWSEIAVIAVVALIAIGPKELPGVLRMVGQWIGKARRMAGEFQGQFQEAMREAEMADLKKSFDEVREAAAGFKGGSLMTSLQKDVTSALRIDDPEKPMDPQVAPSVDAAVTDTAVTSTETPVIPTTPEAPTAETFAEATVHESAIHQSVTEPLAITPAVPTEPAASHVEPSPTEPVAPELQRDAKAS